MSGWFLLMITLINVGILAINAMLSGLSLKMYTEYFKDKAIGARK